MSTHSHSHSHSQTQRLDQETISALMDGQLHGADLTAALRGAETAAVREDWLIYHLVGDVLRSAELARGDCDLAFAERVSQCLNEQARPDEPAAAALGVVRDAGQAAANDGVFRWKMVAGLASLAALAAIGWTALGHGGPAPVGVVQLASAPAPAGVRADSAAAGSAQVVALAGASAAVPAAPALAGSATVPAVMWRDPQLDELLAAHRAAAGASALGRSAGFLRDATFEGAGR